jgi:hypothetical protein
MDYTLIEFLAGIVTIVGFMYKFERDARRDIGELRERLGRVEDRLNLLVRAFMGLNGVMTSLVGQLEKKGVLEGADAWKAALGNITTIIGNPLTPEEKKRLLEFINRGKDDFTPEEADEFLRLAWRFWSEHMDMEEAWYLLYYAAAIRGRTYGRHNKELTPLKLA